MLAVAMGKISVLKSYNYHVDVWKKIKYGDQIYASRSSIKKTV